MEWNLIPEVYYDLIGRIIPGMLLLLTVIIVILGPVGAIDLFLGGSVSLNAWLAILFLLASYVTAIVLANVWGMASDFVSRILRVMFRKGKPPLHANQDNGIDEWAVFFYKLRKRAPSEASRLLKLQAEQNMCDVLITGLSLLWLVNLWIWLSEPLDISNDRFWLLIGILLSFFSFWRWRGSLKVVYDDTLVTLRHVMNEMKDFESNSTPKSGSNP